MQKESKKILITGASRGIGKDIALKSKEKGYEVLGTSTTNEGVSNLRENGIHGLQLNLNDKKSVESFNYLLTQEHPDIAVLVNNAGITRDNIVLRMTEEEWMDVLNINLNGAFKISKTVLKFMLKKRWGRILNITSTSASTGNRGQANYAASKAGIIGLTKSMAKELGSRNITVNAVSPGYILTDMTDKLDEEVKEKMKSSIPLGRLGTPQDVANLVFFLASDEAEYITGQTFNVDGGMVMI